MGSKVSLAIIGRNEIVREGLSRILVDQGFDIVATSVDADALRDMAIGRLALDLIIIDAPSKAEGHAACRSLRTDFPTARIVLLGEDFSVQTTSETMSVGADGYLAKHISCEPLARSLQLVASGEKVVPSQTVLAMIAADWSRPSGGMSSLTMPSDVRLSERERGVLRCLTRGDANKQISRELDITEATVKVHVKAIMRKLGVLNRTQAAILAVTRGLVESPVVQSVTRSAAQAARAC
ncbi:LuxR C-terminal-related transcriptional regulator [Polymorphobacter fuscus]|nr:response regulator transcription factor [Polymorphobacter fuscus]NJC08778.1 two-component system nitrate/nitrite response regulator NarL [Polymorphobacter fuscus]